MKRVAIICLIVSMMTAFISGLCAGYTFALGYNFYAAIFIALGFLNARNVEKAYQLYKKSS